MSPTIIIRPARMMEDLEAAASLFRAYAISLGIDLSFQNFESELSTLPGKYAPPGGEILLAFSSNSTLLGCVAMRPLIPPDSCEMKRLYVLPEGRGSGVGKVLLKSILEVGRERGYKEVKLDTLGNMTAAQKLYEKEGFRVVEAYYDTPLEGTIFMSMRLDE